MGVENIVKVMNFHALLRVNDARRRVSRAYEYEKELKYILYCIVNNRIFKQEKISLELPKGKKELNIYIGSDLGFCASYNADVLNVLLKDDPKNDKILIGKKIFHDAQNVLLTLTKEEFQKNNNIVNELMMDKLINKEYSRINLIYIHYYNLSKQKIQKRAILPFDYTSDEIAGDSFKEIKAIDDFVVEGDLEYILWNLIVTYLSIEIKIADAWGWASENVQRQMFTNSSLNKIKEQNEEKRRIERKEIKSKEFKQIIENNNRRKNKEED